MGRLGLGYDLRHGSASGFGCVRRALQSLPPADANADADADTDTDADADQEEEAAAEEKEDGPCGVIVGEAARTADRMSAEALAIVSVAIVSGQV